MQRIGSYLDDKQGELLLTAYRLARKSFPNATSDELLDLLELCRKNNGLFIDRDLEIVMGVFWYYPGSRIAGKKMVDIVKEYDLDTLKLLDLREGSVLHIVGYVGPKGAFPMVRKMIHDLNPRAVSTHREKPEGRYFALRKNTSHHV